MALEPQELAEFAIARAKQDKVVRARLEIVRRLDGLTEDPRYRYLLGLVKEKQNATLHRLAKRLMAGDEVKQREIDFARGYFRGAVDAIERPETALEDLEMAARHAYLAAQLELTSEEEGEQPYV